MGAKKHNLEGQTSLDGFVLDDFLCFPSREDSKRGKIFDIMANNYLESHNVEEKGVPAWTITTENEDKIMKSEEEELCLLSEPSTTEEHSPLSVSQMKDLSLTNLSEENWKNIYQFVLDGGVRKILARSKFYELRAEGDYCENICLIEMGRSINGFDPH